MKDNLPILMAAGLITSVFFAGAVMSTHTDHGTAARAVKEIIAQEDKREAEKAEYTAEIETIDLLPLSAAQDETQETTQDAKEEDRTPDILPCYTHGIDYITIREYNLLCRVVQSEASIEPPECQRAVAETILNRLVMGGYGDTIEAVCYYPNAYSIEWNGEPTESVRQAVLDVLQVQENPSDMIYFRLEHYHEEYGEPYKQIGTTYFSLKGKE